MTAAGYAQGRPVAVPALFGGVMGLVAVTVGFATLGVFVSRDSGGAAWWIAWLGALGALSACRSPAPRQPARAGAAVAFGLLDRRNISTTVNYYAPTDPTALRQAFGATALFIGGLGAGGYAIRRDLSFLYRFPFWACSTLLVAGDRADLRADPGGLHGSGRWSAWGSSGSTRWSISTA